MKYLKYNTAVTIMVGIFVDESDGATPETALVIGHGDVYLSKNGGSYAAKNDNTDLAHDALGYYTCVLDATDTGSLGSMRLAINAAGALPVFEDFMVVPANVYDSLVNGSDLLNVSTAGAGAIAWEFTLVEPDLVTPIGDADVWVTTDEAGTNIIASLKTDQFGKCTFYLDAGDVWIWKQKTGYDFPENPQKSTVVAP